MSVMIPSAELRALWAAEELWDWRVRMLFAAVCVIVALIALAIYLAWGRDNERGDPPRARRYMGRLCVTTLVVTVAESSFFGEPTATAFLAGTAVVVGLIGLSFPPAAPEDARPESDEEGRP